MRKTFKRYLSRRIAQFRMSFNFARKNITRSKYRSCLLIFGVLLTIALETGIVISVDTLYDNFIFDNRNQNYTDITVNPKDWLELQALDDMANNIRNIPGVSKTSSTCYFIIDSFRNQSIPRQIIVYGIDAKNHPDFSHMCLKDTPKKFIETFSCFEYGELQPEGRNSFRLLRSNSVLFLPSHLSPQ